MKITGIVSEYNPFHKGHIKHINESKRSTNCDLLINVMSPNVVQRGDFAVCDKWIRAQAAIENGCDVVFEIPSYYVLQNSDRYASGAIKTLALANVDTIVFGSESNNIAELILLSQQNPVFDNTRSFSAQYPKSLKSNDRLGIAYIKACESFNIIPKCIKRVDTPNERAHTIRALYYDNEDISKLSPIANEIQNVVMLANFYPTIQYILNTQSSEMIKSYFLVDEGIENLLKKNAKVYDEYPKFLDACISKRYTRSKIQRTLMHLLLQNRKAMMNEILDTSYLRVLAYNKKGRAYIRRLQDSGINVISKFANIPESYRHIDEKINYLWASKIMDGENRKKWLLKEFQKPFELDN